MRVTFLLAAAALVAAGPAAAQDTTAADTNASVGVADNMVVVDNTSLAGDVVVDNATTGDADTAMARAAEPAPAPRENKGFPWGVLGLIGLVGLIGRKRD